MSNKSGASFIMTTVIGGVVFLIPVIILVVIIAKAAGFMMIVAEPMASWLPVDTIGGVALANVIAIPDCEVLPEQLAGLTEGVVPSSQFARRLAQSGCRVVVPLLINRQRKQFDWGPRPAVDITNREMLYRSAFELGRTMIGYEVQKVLAIVDWYQTQYEATPIGVTQAASEVALEWTARAET